MSIHRTAIIEEGAELGADVTVGPYAVIESHTKVGDGCVIASHAHICQYTELGPGCTVHSTAVLGGEPQDLAFKPVESYTRIGANCTLREGVTIHRGTKEGTVTLIGDNCYLMAFSHLGHNVEMGRNVVLVNGALMAGYVHVGDGAFISGNAVVHQFCRVGRLAMLGGNCGISKDVPPFCTTASVVRNAVTGLNVVGLRRDGVDVNGRKAVKEAFRLLYRAGLNISAAVARIRAEVPHPLATEFCDFVEASERGVCGHREKKAEE